MDLSYMYFKLRRNFGRQPLLCEVAPHLLDTISPDKKEQKHFILRNPVNRESQAYTSKSEQYVNTPEIKYAVKGIEHTEGGWPKEINCNDEEATTRHRRRIERDDDYVNAILTVVPKLEHLVRQNNGIDMYQHYFKGMPPTECCEKPSFQFGNIFKDPTKQEKKRPVACIDWTFEDDSKLVVAYCNKMYTLHNLDTDLTCYLWNIEDPNQPITELTPPTACWQLACSPSSPAIIIGGLADGRVCIFDVRKNKEPTEFSPMHLAHRDPVTSLLFLQSRTNNAFFSGSADGRCIWYDIRNLSEPTDTLIVSLKEPEQIPNMANAEPINVLQFDSATPTRFYCGTGTGLVVNINRKGKTHSDIMSRVFQAHTGPVKALQRNYRTSKMFITCGDWAINIWSEDVKSSPIITGTKQRYQVQDVAWAPNRYSCYMSVGDDGKIRYWDVLRKLHEPLIIFRISKCSLLKIKCQGDGRCVAIGDKNGSVYLLSLSEALITPCKNEKQVIMQMYERETRRENILEARLKEIHVKAKADQEVVTEYKEVNEEATIRDCEEEYRRIVLEEVRRADRPMLCAR